ncbi:MAG: PrsW family intramembrane metalloprotease [Lewinella sp.]|nr:PrsW family intramembrane metalloprotease [Lewinella sp.]
MSRANLLLALLVAILPVIGLAWLIYRADLHEREARQPVLTAFTLGILIFIPARFGEAWLLQQWGSAAGLASSLLVAFGVIAPVEEGCKAVTLRAYPYSRPFFNEPMDGIVFAGMIGLGFALSENLYFAWTHAWQATVFRALTTVPMHAILAIILGYWVGRARFDAPRELYLWLIGIGSTWLLHGAYNFLLLQEAYDGLLYLSAPLLGAAVLLAIDLVRRHQDNSPFR